MVWWCFDVVMVGNGVVVADVVMVGDGVVVFGVCRTSYLRGKPD